jgi:hypothetical protein
MSKEKNNLEDLCVNLEIAKSQLERELKEYNSTDGCAGFKQIGCYECSGYKTDCMAYLPAKELN